MSEIKMSKTITLEYNDKQYTLEFNRKSIRRMEESGFEISSIEKMPVSGILRLFHGAFLMHHPWMTEQVSTAIYETLRHKKDSVSKLGEMYSDPVIALLDDSEEDGEDEKNVGWGASW